jgi:hypothetical protein
MSASITYKSTPIRGSALEISGSYFSLLGSCR